MMLRSFTTSKPLPKDLQIKGIQHVKLASNVIAKRALYDVAGKRIIVEPLYATPDKIAAMESVIKIADRTNGRVSEQDLVSIRKTFGPKTSKSIIGSMLDNEQGLCLKSSEAKDVYELFTGYQITLNKNAEIFEDLSISYGLTRSSKEKEEGPILKMKK